MEKNKEIARQVAQTLLQIKAIKLSPQNPFTWASGKTSPIYCDNRKLLSYPNARNLVKNGMAHYASQFGNFSVVAGVATAGIPHGVLLADLLNKPFVYVRDKPKAHGLQNAVEGDLRGNERILVVEDLISTGGSSLKVVDTLETIGCRVAGVLAIFSYGFPAATQAFADANCPLITLTNYDTLLEEALQYEYITPDDIQTLQHWRTHF